MAADPDEVLGRLLLQRATAADCFALQEARRAQELAAELLVRTDWAAAGRRLRRGVQCACARSAAAAAAAAISCCAGSLEGCAAGEPEAKRRRVQQPRRLELDPALDGIAAGEALAAELIAAGARPRELAAWCQALLVAAADLLPVGAAQLTGQGALARLVEDEAQASWDAARGSLGGPDFVTHRMRIENRLHSRILWQVRLSPRLGQPGGYCEATGMHLGSRSTLLVTRADTQRLSHLALAAAVACDDPEQVMQELLEACPPSMSDVPAPEVPNTRKCHRDKGWLGRLQHDPALQRAILAEREAVARAQLPSKKEERRVFERAMHVFKGQNYNERLREQRFLGSGTVPFMPFCQLGSPEACKQANGELCSSIHLHKLVTLSTKEQMGDCPYLDACRRMHNCDYIHYKLIPPEGTDLKRHKTNYSQWMIQKRSTDGRPVPLSLGMSQKPLLGAQWIRCDIRSFDMRILGKFQVIMADPPWDIHMELPYGTVSDDEMRRLDLGALQDDGVLFLWVTGRAMELGRECIRRWGYTLRQELVWIKINQVQRLTRTGRTGHWLNHSKEHCLIAIKGNPQLNAGVDCDVLATEVRETSRKPDEVYGMIERLCPDGRKLELFGRNHNIRDGWVTLGNQLAGVHIIEPQLKAQYNRYVEEEISRLDAADSDHSRRVALPEPPKAKTKV
eukprot:TRINITY_DN1863_c0_g1_i1.p1 TRINITY_DN1863_c0_g1~~TRINITY_DN1863_c0_g1_i1.p1  ORF type:complete len:705 (+),score=263.29 TRINITY_DN1863_c0_g1_i1:78-2117(+)